MLLFGFAAPAANPPKGPLAQLGERYVRIVEVASSILARSTNKIPEKNIKTAL
jgi:hypothetical protein